jgi:hypothetical protein
MFNPQKKMRLVTNLPILQIVAGQPAVAIENAFAFLK